MMADFIVRNQAQTAEDLKAFNTGGYQFNADASDAKSLVFLRAER